MAYDGVGAINLIGPLEAFANAYTPQAESEGQLCYEVVVASCTGATFATDSRLTFVADASASMNRPFDTLIVPGGTGLQDEATREAAAAWINKYAGGARRIASICTGIYGLAPTGLLDHRRVTTHWAHAAEVARRFPKLNVEESALVLRDGRFYSSAGATAGIDLALALIAEDFGHEISLRVARKLLVYLRRDGGQEQYAEPSAVYPRQLATRGSSKPALDKLVRWIQQNLGENLANPILAKRVSMAPNDFIVQFKTTFGISPALFVKNLRFNEARRRLMAGESPTQVAASLGLRSSNYFIQEFRRRFGALPDVYQRRFTSIGTVADAGDLSQKPNLATALPEGNSQLGYVRPQLVSFTRCARQKPSLIAAS